MNEHRDLTKKTQYNIQYAKKKIKRVPLDMQLSDYEKLKVAATAIGEGVNTYIKKAIAERMERERAGDDGSSTGGQFPYSTDNEDTPLVTVGSSPTEVEESSSAEPDFSKMTVEEWIEWKRRRTGESDRTWCERVRRSINAISKVGCSPYWNYLAKLSPAEKDILNRKNWRN